MHLKVVNDLLQKCYDLLLGDRSQGLDCYLCLFILTRMSIKLQNA